MKLAALALMIVVWSANEAAAQRFSLSIGNNAGDSTDEELRWAEEDARRAHDLLAELGDVKEANARIVLGGNADAVRRELASLRQQVERAHAGQETMLLAYYSGHGDADSLHLSGSRMSLREFEQLLRAIPVTTLVTIVDACRTAPGVRAKGAHHAEPFDIRFSREMGPSGRVLITAAGNDEVAQESDKLRSSFFTHHLLSGMRGAADRDGDRQVSLDELYSYAYHTTLASSHAHLASVQHPQLAVDLQGEGDLVITRLRRAQSVLELAPALAGDVMIVDDNSGQVVAELYKPIGRAARVALDAGRFRVQVRSGAKAFAGEVGLEWGGHATVSEDTLTREDLRSVQAKGRRLDPQPFLLLAGLRTGPATAGSEAWLWGGGVRASLDLSIFRLFTDAQLGAADASRLGQSHSYLETRVGVGGGPRLNFGPLELFAAASAGALHVYERFRSPQRRFEDGAFGMYLGPLLGLQLPLLTDFVLALQAELQLSVLRVDSELGVRATPSFALMFGRHL